jgi:hypothetical protein
MSPIVDFIDATTIERGQRLRDAIAKKADAMAAGDDPWSTVELEQVLGLCEEYFLVGEAARVRRWMGRS